MFPEDCLSCIPTGPVPEPTFLSSGKSQDPQRGNKPREEKGVLEGVVVWSRAWLARLTTSDVSALLGKAREQPSSFPSSRVEGVSCVDGASRC